MSLKAIFRPAAFAVTVAAALAFTLTACETVEKKPLPQKPAPLTPGKTGAVAGKPSGGEVRVGLLLPLSGRYADVGRALLNAAAVSLFDTGDSRLVLVPRDTGGTVEGAEAAAAALLADDVDIIAGPLLAGEVRAVSAAVKNADPQAGDADRSIKIIGFSTDRSVAGNGVYLLSFTPEEEVRRVVEYAASEGKTTFAALVPETPYGDTVGKAFRSSVAGAGGRLTDFVIYPPETGALMQPVKTIANYDARKRALAELQAYRKDMTGDAASQEELARLTERAAPPYQAILLPEGAALLRVMAPLLPYYDVDPKKVQVLGTGLWNDPSLAREPQLQGGWFAAPSQEKAGVFLDRYRSLYRSEPPRIATLAYDAVALAGVLSQSGDRNPFSADALMSSDGFTGIDGVFRFKADGVAERGLAVMTFGHGGIELVSPAPASFAPSTQ